MFPESVKENLAKVAMRPACFFFLLWWCGVVEANDDCPLRVLGAGFGRTGTLSLKHALGQVGYRSYHMDEVFQHGSPHIKAWDSYAGGGTMDWEWLLEGYDAAVDFPVGLTFVWQDLLKICPDAKVILTERDSPEQWVESAMATILTLYSEGQKSIATRVLFSTVPMFRAHISMWKKMTSKLFNFNEIRLPTKDDAEVAKAAYVKNSALARELVPAENLLVFNVKEGWAPLCAFLGVAECPEGAFPRVNNRDEFVIFFRNIQIAAVAIPLVLFLVIFVGILFFITPKKTKKQANKDK